MIEERKNLLTSMVSRSDSYYAVQQKERVEEMKKHIDRLHEFLLSGGGTADSTIRTPEDESCGFGLRWGMRHCQAWSLGKARFRKP